MSKLGAKRARVVVVVVVVVVIIIVVEAVIIIVVEAVIIIVVVVVVVGEAEVDASCAFFRLNKLFSLKYTGNTAPNCYTRISTISSTDLKPILIICHPYVSIP